MIIELDELFCHNTSKLVIDKDIVFDNQKYTNNEIRELKDVHFFGDIHYNADETIGLSGNLKGTMVLMDAISLDDIDYNFDTLIDTCLDEFIEKDKNSIDILEILWQNIVLEIPLKYTKVSDLSKYQGDGWKVISEDEIKRDNPFSVLATKLEEMEKE